MKKISIYLSIYLSTKNIKYVNFYITQDNIYVKLQIDLRIDKIP